jgi:hypothetical protein
VFIPSGPIFSHLAEAFTAPGESHFLKRGPSKGRHAATMLTDISMKDQIDVPTAAPVACVNNKREKKEGKEVGKNARGNSHDASTMLRFDIAMVRRTPKTYPGGGSQWVRLVIFHMG